jgi:hypothetical protein
MDRHRRGPEDHHEIDGDFIERWHWLPAKEMQNCVTGHHHVMVS